MNFSLFLSTALFVEGLFSNIKQLPIDAATQLISIVNGKQINLSAKTSQCYNPTQNDIRLILYTRTHPGITLNMRNPTQIDPEKKIVIIIHGWFSNPSTFGFPDLRDAYLKRYDANVIMLDWAHLAWQTYTTAFCFIPKIGHIMGNFFCGIKKKTGMSLNNVHLVGHSFGAQMSSFISETTYATCAQKIGRITAMDPAKPIYQKLPASQRLDREDATFIDVLHTNQLIFGYTGDCGHVDFYVNCGAVQPGCPNVHLDHIVNNPIAAVSCDHFRSVEYMAESINSNSFIAKPCRNCQILCSADDTGRNEIFMGEDCPKNASGSYIVDTNAETPFGKRSTRSATSRRRNTLIFF